MNAITRFTPRDVQQAAPRQPIYDARLLTKGNPCATILLDDQTYILRITKTGKLILTK